MRPLVLLPILLLAACGTTGADPFCVTVDKGQVTSINFKPSREQNREFLRNRDRGALFPSTQRPGGSGG